MSSVVKTPIWTGDPGKMAQFSIADNDVAVSVEDVARTMLELVQDGKYPGGTIFKIDTGVAEVATAEDPGVAADGERAEAVARMREKMVQPVVELLRAERGSSRTA